MGKIDVSREIGILKVLLKSKRRENKGPGVFMEVKEMMLLRRNRYEKV